VISRIRFRVEIQLAHPQTRKALKRERKIKNNKIITMNKKNMMVTIIFQNSLAIHTHRMLEMEMEVWHYT
jgi:hypothetical protein